MNSIKNITEFTAWLNAAGFVTRNHTSVIRQGIQVQHDGHWMAVVRNKHTNSYTVDRRLAPYIREFKDEPAISIMYENPRFTKQKWREDLGNINGYWQWVYLQIGDEE